jgi:D-amino-acid dehydrogenase
MAKSVLIIGGGVIGLTSAYYASRRGFEVLVVDGSRVDHEGCSHGNAGMVVPSHFIPLAAPGTLLQAFKWMWNPQSPLYVKPSLSPDLLKWGWSFWRASTAERVERASVVLRDLHLASRAAFIELSQHPGMDFGLVQKGLFMLCKTPAALDHEAKTAALANRLGVPAQVLDARQTAALDPAAEMDVLGSVHFPKDCHLSPHRFMASLRRQLMEAGVTFHWKTQVQGFRVEGSRIRAVQTDRGELEADEVVVCGGAWSMRLGRQLGLRLPLQAGKGYSVTLPNPRQLPQVCSLLTEARVAVTPMEGVLRVGGTMEIAGLNETVNPRRVQGILKALPTYYPAFTVEDFAGLKPWVGLRPVSPDGLPYLGRASRWSNVIIATGHAMMGLSLAPVTGKIVASLLAGEAPGFDLGFLSPERFG